MRGRIIIFNSSVLLDNFDKYTSHINQIVAMTRAAPGPEDALAAPNNDSMLLDAPPSVVQLPMKGKEGVSLAKCSSSHIPHLPPSDPITMNAWQADFPPISGPLPHIACHSTEHMGRPISGSSVIEALHHRPSLPVLNSQNGLKIVKDCVPLTSATHPHLFEGVQISDSINGDEGNISQSCFTKLRSSRVPAR